MKIFYDSCAFDAQIFGGVPKYFANIIQNVSKQHHVNIGLQATDNYDFKRLVTNEISSFENICKTNNLSNIIEAKILNMQISYNYILKNDFDIFHHTFYNDYFLDIIKKPFVYTIHDLLQDKLYGLKTCANCAPCLDKLSEKASKIIAISETTKKDLIELYNVPENKIEVIYHGYEKLPKNYEYEKLNFDFKYILYVGARLNNTDSYSINYKNYIPFINQIVTFLHKHKDYKLIVVGNKFNVFENDINRQLRIQEQVINLTNVNDDVLNSLYHNAECFVFPSEYEGFGLPILEAYKNNCLTILNNNQVFKEIGCKDGLFIDITDGVSLNNTLETIFEMTNEEKQNILNNQQKRLKDFSWEKSAQEHIKLYESLL